jgi:hypothetical protein
LFSVALIVASTLIAALGDFGFGILLRRRQERVLIDPQTNHQVILSHGDSLYFIPVRCWTWIFLAIALLVALGALLRSITGVTALGTQQAAKLGHR